VSFGLWISVCISGGRWTRSGLGLGLGGRWWGWGGRRGCLLVFMTGISIHALYGRTREHEINRDVRETVSSG
jgi:hypothetical protein